METTTAVETAATKATATEASTTAAVPGGICYRTERHEGDSC
jgi:hypothetical protein